MNNEKTLFIFEGAKTEDKLVEKLEQNFLGKTNAIKCVFDAEIYQLYRAIKEENEFSIDMVSLLKERTAENAKILKDYTRDSFAYIYLFFDYDAHSTLADDDKIKEMDNLIAEIDKLNYHYYTLDEPLLSSTTKLKKECFTSAIQWWKPYGISRIWKVSSC